MARGINEYLCREDLAADADDEERIWRPVKGTEKKLKKKRQERNKKRFNFRPAFQPAPQALQIFVPIANPSIWVLVQSR